MTAKGGCHKKGLNREILNTTPSVFFKLLQCKAEEAGVHWIEIPMKKVKPSQTCHRCGVRKKKQLSERVHQCTCGIACSRDANAAQVILNWALFGEVTGQELSEVVEPLSDLGFAQAGALKHETSSITPCEV